MSLFCLAFCIIIGFSISASAQQSSSIPSWVKNTAKWWHENSIGDDEFMKGIQYLIQQKIIKISDTSQGSQSMQHVPPWVKNTAGFWADGKTSDGDFTKAIEYLVNVGIIQIGTGSTQTSIPTPTPPVIPPTPPPTQQTPNLNSTISSNTQPYTESLVGTGINLKIVNNTASGTLSLNGKQYSASNLLWIIKGNQIQLTGNVVGSDSVLLELTGIHTTGIEYKFYGSVMSNANSVPVTFTALFVIGGKQSTTTTIQNTTSTTPMLPMLMLTSNYDRVYMKYPYNFVVKIFDPKTNPDKNIDQFNGGISNVDITANILDQNSHLFAQLAGKTDNKGIYQDGVLIPYSDYKTEQMKVIVNATKKGYIAQSATMFFVILHNDLGGSTEVVNPPTGLTPSLFNATRVNLLWTAPTSGTIKAYEIEKAVNGTAWSILVGNTGNTTTAYSKIPVFHHTKYDFRVSTVGNTHNSQPSVNATITTP
ncbi:MAG TPA: fibronectin type III domain-containing protein [Nitrosopumilaceae archaeon]|nr:fibronectin type III domain-containing protein [Nitrosopumilaceae archaeon]